MSQIDEIVTEDIGFAVAGAEHGFRLFDNNVDESNIAGKFTSLLAIGNARGFFAASNGSQLVLSSLDDIAFAEKEKKAVDKVVLPESFPLKITQVAFNRSNEILAIVLGGSLYISKTDSYFSTKEVTLTTHPNVWGGDSIVSIEPCPYLDDTWLVLYQSRVLHLLNDTDSTEIAQNVTAYAFDQSTFYYTTKQSLVVYRGDKVPVFNAADMDSSWAADEQARIIYIREIQQSLAWFAVVEIEGSPDLTAFVVDISQGIQSPQYFEAEVADPWSDTDRFPNYYTASLTRWLPGKSLFFATTAKSSEIGTIQISPETGVLATLVQADDSQRALFPLVDDDDCFPVGMAIDVHLKSATVYDPCPGVSEVTGKLPRLIILLELGDLVSWWVFDKKALMNDTVSLEDAAQEYVATAANSMTSKQSFAEPTNREKKSNAPSSLPAGENPFGSGSLNDNPFATSTPGPFMQTPSAPTSAGTDTSNASLAIASAPASLAGPTANDSKAAFGSTGFGDSALGNTPLADAGFGNTSFGAASFGAASFGNASFGQSAFGAIKKTTATPGSQSVSGFGSYASATTPSFGSSSGAVSSTSSPFASLNQSGETNSTKLTSPFGASNASSPFASLMQSGKAEGEKSSGPFGTTSTSSPLASLKHSGEADADKASSPSGATSASSPFASLKQSGENDATKKSSPSSGIGALSGGAVKPLNDSNDPSASPFAQFREEESSAAQEETLPSANSRPSPFGSKSFMGMQNDLSHITEEQDGNSGSQIDATRGGSLIISSGLENNDNDSDSVGGSFSGDNSLDGSDEEVSFAATPLVKLKKTGDLRDLSKAHSSQIESEIRSSPDSASTPESEAERETSKVKLSKAQISTAKTDGGQPLLIPSDTIAQPPSLSSQQSLVTAVEEADFLLHVEPPQFGPLWTFGGLISTDKENEVIPHIPLHIKVIIQETEANLLTLMHNTARIQELFEFHLRADPIHLRSRGSLLVPDKWRLSHLNDVEELYKQFREANDETRDLLKEASQSAQELVDQIKQSQQEIQRINKMFSQLRHHRENVASAVLKRRPLDLQTETMQGQVRQKYQRVLDLEKQLRTIMMPIKAKKGFKPESVKDFDRIVFDIDRRARVHQHRLDVLVNEMAYLEIGDDESVDAEPELMHHSNSLRNRLLFAKAVQSSRPISRQIGTKQTFTI